MFSQKNSIIDVWQGRAYVSEWYLSTQTYLSITNLTHNFSFLFFSFFFPRSFRASISKFLFEASEIKLEWGLIFSGLTVTHIWCRISQVYSQRVSMLERSIRVIIPYYFFDFANYPWIIIFMEKWLSRYLLVQSRQQKPEHFVKSVIN